jgi:Nitrile hydratase beta subunit
VNAELVGVDGPAAPPRRNGELVFDAPWQSRVFGLCAAIVATCFDGDREPFRQRLIAAIAAEPERPYWDSWTVALQRLVVDEGVIDEFAIERLLSQGEAAGSHLVRTTNGWTGRRSRC